MEDISGIPIEVGDMVEWNSTGWAEHAHSGVVICLLPAYQDIPDEIEAMIREKKYKLTGRYRQSSIDRVIVEVGRPKSCPVLFTPRPSRVRIEKRE